MDIWIMRHGEAGFNAQKDADRELTEKGWLTAKQQGEKLGKIMQSCQKEFDKILVSPYKRAEQTFHAVKLGLQAVKFPQEITTSLVEVWDGITPYGIPENVESYLTFLQAEGAKNVLIISHLPLVYDLVLTLTYQQESVHFHPAVIAEIHCNGNTRQLESVIKP